MNFLLVLKLVSTNLKARKGRTFLTMLGIIIGVAGVIIIISIGAGAQTLVVSQVSKLGSNLIGVLPGKSDETGPPAAVFGIQVTTLIRDDADALRVKNNAPGIKALTGIARGQATVKYRDKETDTFYTGVEGDYPNVQDVPLSFGRFFDTSEEQGAKQVVILGWSVYEDLFPNGDNPLGSVVKVGTLPFEVVGVQSEQGTVAFQNQDDQVLIPLSIAQKQLLGINYLQGIRIRVDAAENITATIADVKSVLRSRHNIRTTDEEDFSVRNLADAIQVLTAITGGLNLFLTAMAAIALLVGGIGIMNIMLVTVTERTREIGLRKAVGARPRSILSQFLLEAMFLTFVGGTIGVVSGIFISLGVALAATAAGYEWSFIVSPLAVMVALGVSIGTGVVFGLYPAYKASKLNPIDALRYE